MRRLPLLLLVVAVASCGGGTDRVVGADFAERADAACAEADAPALGTLPGDAAAADLRERRRRGDDLATAIARLEAPRELRVDRASYVVVVSRLAALSSEAAEAVEAGDRRHLAEVAELQGPLVGRARVLTGRLGLPSCAPAR